MQEDKNIENYQKNSAEEAKRSLNSLKVDEWSAIKSKMFYKSEENMDFVEDPLNLEADEENKVPYKEEEDIFEVRSLFASRMDLKSQMNSRQNSNFAFEESKVEDIYEGETPKEIIQNEDKLSDVAVQNIQDASEVLPSSKYLFNENPEPEKQELQAQNDNLNEEPSAEAEEVKSVSQDFEVSMPELKILKVKNIVPPESPQTHHLHHTEENDWNTSRKLNINNPKSVLKFINRMIEK